MLGEVDSSSEWQSAFQLIQVPDIVLSGLFGAKLVEVCQEVHANLPDRLSNTTGKIASFCVR